MDPDAVQVWLDMASDALRSTDAEASWATISTVLASQFESSLAGQFTWCDGEAGEVLAHPAPTDYDLVEVAARASWLHPLARHYLATGRQDPLAITQVPVLKFAAAQDYLDELGGHGIEQHLWIPLPPSGLSARIAGMCRSGVAFDEAELAHARRIQPTLRSLMVHADVMALWRRGFPSPRLVEQAREASAELRLTGRQVAVLALCAKGLTTATAARRLGISPRTAEKHLENAYRQLGVNERVSAVRRAELLGLLGQIESSLSA